MGDLPAGWDALRRGQCDAARTIFEAAASQHESGESLEGLSWAAWWRDDADAVFAARERAYTLYRHGGEMAAAARLATWLAVLRRARALCAATAAGRAAAGPLGQRGARSRALRRRLSSLETIRSTYVERRPGGPRGYCDFFYDTFGPVIALRACAEDPEALDRDLLDFATAANEGRPGGPAAIPYEYLLVVARKR